MDFSKLSVENLPLKVESASWENDTLLIGGSDWSFSLIGAWRVVRKNRVVCGCDDECAESEIKDIVGSQLVDIQSASAYCANDPLMFFSNGTVLEVFSTTAQESWVLRLNKDGIVYVSVPSSGGI